MGVRTALEYVLAAVIVVVLLSLLLGQVLGQPLLLTYVETDSMSPTIEPDDGYVVVPPVVAGEISEGDIILFEAVEIDDGGLTTHRVVDVTEDGYITRGDNNPFTDQDGGEPVVSEGQIRGVALQVGGKPVVVPSLGVFVEGVQTLLVGGFGLITGALGLRIQPNVTTLGVVAILFGLGVLLINVLVEEQRYQRSYDRRRGSFVLRGGVVTILLIAVILIPANASMLLPAGVAEYSVITSVEEPNSPNEVPVGGDLGVNYTTENSGLIPVVVVLDPASTGVEIEQRVHTLPRQSVTQTDVMLQTPSEPGLYPRFIRESRYLKVLPESWLVSLHRKSPLLALGAVNLVIGTLVGLVSLSLFGTGPLRLRSRSRDVSGFSGLRRYL